MAVGKNLARLVGERIREARKASGLSQAVLALRAGIETQTVSRIERGKFFPSLLTLVEIAGVLEKHLDYFVTGEAPPEDFVARRILREVEKLAPDDRRLVLEFTKTLRRFRETE